MPGTCPVGGRARKTSQAANGRSASPVSALGLPPPEGRCMLPSRRSTGHFPRACVRYGARSPTLALRPRSRPRGFGASFLRQPSCRYRRHDRSIVSGLLGCLGASVGRGVAPHRSRPPRGRDWRRPVFGSRSTWCLMRFRRASSSGQPRGSRTQFSRGDATHPRSPQGPGRPWFGLAHPRPRSRRRARGTGPPDLDAGRHREVEVHPPRMASYARLRE
jgi:hypothetical protein